MCFSDVSAMNTNHFEHQRKQNLRQRGFTLIEVMVTIVIVSIGMLALAGLLVTGIKVNSTSEARMDASALAQSIAARLAVNAATAGYAQATAITDARAILADRYDANGLGGGYNPDVVITPTPTVTGSFTSIIVRLQWDDHGSTKQVELRSGTVTN